jgi:hypothetical protein
MFDVRKPLLAALLCVYMATPALAQHKDKNPNVDLTGVATIYLYNPVPPGQKALSFTGLQSLTVPPTATIAEIQNCGTVTINYWDDGVDVPTATTGITLAAGEPMQISGAQLAAIQFFPASGTGCLNALYYVNN